MSSTRELPGLARILLNIGITSVRFLLDSISLEKAVGMARARKKGNVLTGV